jgi:hypothetical protein
MYVHWVFSKMESSVMDPQLVIPKHAWNVWGALITIVVLDRSSPGSHAVGRASLILRRADRAAQVGWDTIAVLAITA